MCAKIHKVLIFFLPCDIVCGEITRSPATFNSFILLCSSGLCSQYTTEDLDMRNVGPVLSSTHNRHWMFWWGKLLRFSVPWFVPFVQGVPLLDFFFHFPFWKATYVTAPRLLSIIIYHNLEMNSKYRLNIFQLSMNDNLE